VEKGGRRQMGDGGTDSEERAVLNRAEGISQEIGIGSGNG
jgi:hypothetical protein